MAVMIKLDWLAILPATASTGYTTQPTNQVGEQVEVWEEVHQLSLPDDPKLPNYINKCYNTNWHLIPGFCNKTILKAIPHSQHRPIILKIKAVVIAIFISLCCHFNFKKAKWNDFIKHLDAAVVNIKPIP